jgi:hypothetical protein
MLLLPHQVIIIIDSLEVDIGIEINPKVIKVVVVVLVDKVKEILIIITIIIIENPVIKVILIPNNVCLWVKGI